MKLVLAAAFCLSILLQIPVLANTESAPDAVALICFDATTGHQIIFDKSKEAAACPDGYQAYPLLRFEQIAGAPPLTDPKEQPEKEGHDAEREE